MKNKPLFPLFVTILFASVQNIKCQVTVPGNVRPALPAFLGWNGAGFFPGDLQVRNNFNDHINIFTNGGRRMQISQISAPGIPNPGNIIPANRTRISMSNDPAFPITRPLSLLHLGYDYIFIGGVNGGWRPWMEVGMSIAYDTDNMYLGFLDHGLNNKDAVLAWGDDQRSSVSSI